MSWFRLVPIQELLDGRAHRFDVDDCAVCVTRNGDCYYAMSDVCPHKGASLSAGLLRNGCITCPSHVWRFSVVDGVMQGNEYTRVPVYSTRSVDSWLEVDLPPKPMTRTLRETLLAHARGEQSMDQT